jgi:N-acetylglucosaminyl-diphospho-decaprenol L-rhamnosyltransferase
MNLRRRLGFLVPTLSIITVTHQSAAMVPQFLQSARGAAADAEVIVVDNASSDRTVQIAAEVDPQARIIRLPGNDGFGRGCNLGAENAVGDWLLFVNPDVRLVEVSLPSRFQGRTFGLGAAETLMRTDGSPGTPTLRADTSLVEDWAREILGRFVPPALTSRIPIRQTPPAWVSGAAFLVRRAEFVEMTGFDRRFFLYCEDRDLGARYRRAGLPIRSVDGLRGLHAPHSSSSGMTASTKSAWALVSWLEYVGIWHGQDTADRLTRSVLLSLKAGLRAVNLSRRAHSFSILTRKGDELAMILSFLTSVDQRLPNGDTTYYPHARRALQNLVAGC